MLLRFIFPIYLAQTCFLYMFCFKQQQVQSLGQVEGIEASISKMEASISKMEASISEALTALKDDALSERKSEMFFALLLADKQSLAADKQSLAALYQSLAADKQSLLKGAVTIRRPNSTSIGAGSGISMLMGT
jgi:hypothetical protein